MVDPVTAIDQIIEDQLTRTNAITNIKLELMGVVLHQMQSVVRFKRISAQMTIKV